MLSTTSAGRVDDDQRQGRSSMSDKSKSDDAIRRYLANRKEELASTRTVETLTLLVRADAVAQKRKARSDMRRRAAMAKRALGMRDDE
jgi:hypothetical protein